MGWPRPSNSSSSAISTSGSTTQPLPITHGLPRTIPLGSARILYVSSPTTIVCPAFGPPWYRQTMSESCARRSTILPFPSSPHCAPTMTVAGTRASLARAMLAGLGGAEAADARGGPGHEARSRARSRRDRDGACHRQRRCSGGVAVKRRPARSCRDENEVVLARKGRECLAARARVPHDVAPLAEDRGE